MKEQEIELTHSFSIEEAIRLGSIEKAIILKEIRRMAAYKTRTNKNPWVYYSAQALADKFPYMTRRSIDRWLKELIDAGEMIYKVENKIKYDQTRSYLPRQFVKSDGQDGPSIGQNGQPIPPLSPPLEILHSENPKKDFTPRVPVKRKPYNEAASSDSYETVIDADTSLPEIEVKADGKKTMQEMLVWAVKRRGGPFRSLPKQIKALSDIKNMGYAPHAVYDRWIELENEEFYREKGFDFADVASSLSRKPPRK